MRMHIFAIRDRLIDYYMTPFVAPGEKEVMASLSTLINNPENTDAIAQAPHQFELHQLGIVQEDGHITVEKTYICDCASLIRPSVRKSTGERSGAEQGGGTPPRSQDTPGGVTRTTDA